MATRILLVEDDGAQAGLVIAALQNESPAVVVAPRLDEALNRVRTSEFDAVILDLNLPDSEGLQTFRRLSSEIPDTPIVILTSMDDDAIAAAALRGGAEEYLVKGADPVTLARVLRHAIERHSYRDALRTAEFRYRTLVEGAVQGILIHVNGVIRFTNQALADLAGASTADEMIGQSIWSFIPADDRALVARYAEARLAGRAAPSRYELRVVHHDGSMRWVDCAVSVIGWDGELALMVALVDVTDRKQAEEHLRASEQRFRLLADNIKEAFLIAEVPTGRTLYLSRVWEQIWGRPVEEAYANPHLWMQAIDPADQPAVLADHERLTRGEAATTVFRVHRPDRSTSWVRARLFPVRNDRGDVYRLVGLIEDITQIRQTEDQLRQALKMEAVGQLAGGVAHDFNNLLVVIDGYADLIARELGATHSSRSDVEEIRTAARSAASLTRQLLAFSRRQILQPQVLDVNQAIRRVELLLRRVLGENITLAFELAKPLARVHADPGQLEQIIMNLAVNARDAMSKGGRLTIETADVLLDEVYVAQHPGASAGPHVMIAVNDTGVGMDRETQRRLFEPFFTTKPPGRGTGLGLSTVYGIVKQSGGSIWVYSELGKGSTFKIYLPATTRLDVPVEAPPASQHLAGTETVLVVEDQADVRRLIVETLKRHRYRVLDAADQAEAIRLVREWPVDLLLTDVVLPTTSGRDIARRLFPCVRRFASSTCQDMPKT